MDSWLFILLLTYFICRSQQQTESIDMLGGTTQAAVDKLYDRYKKRYKGEVSFFGDYSIGTGACFLDPLPPIVTQKGWTKVALGKEDFQNSISCSSCVKLEAQDVPDFTPNKETFYGVVVDQCQDCKKGEIQLYDSGKVDKNVIFNFMDCPEVPGTDGMLRIRLTQATDKYLKMQIKNSKLPVISFEIFHKNRWKCTRRSPENYFILTDDGVFSFPLQGRITSITGQTIGIQVDSLTNDKDLDLRKQFKPFDAASPEESPKLKCVDKIVSNKTDLSELKLPFRNPATPNVVTPFTATNKTILPQNITMHAQPKIENMITDQVPPPPAVPNPPFSPINQSDLKIENITGSISPDGVPARSIPIVSPFCQGKYDGSYSNPQNCRRFIVCARGRTFLKRCPMGLRYNSQENVCDWPKNVNCGSRMSSSLDVSEAMMSQQDRDEDVYTKRFTSNAPENDNDNNVDDDDKNTEIM